MEQCIDCYPTSLLNVRILEKKGMSSVGTLCPKLHKMLDSFRYRVELRNVSRFGLRKWKKE